MINNMEAKVALWNAINEYARTCGGDPSNHVYGNTARQRAVVAVEKAMNEAGEQAFRDGYRCGYYEGSGEEDAAPDAEVDACFRWWDRMGRPAQSSRDGAHETVIP